MSAMSERDERTGAARDGQSREEAQKRGIRRTALLLGGVALLFYFGFIAMNAFFR